MWEIHSVVVHKPISLKIAREHAKNILKNNYKNYKLRNDTQSYRFSKNKKLYKKFRSHVVNDNITLIFGEKIVR